MPERADPTYTPEVNEALGAIRIILDSRHPHATPGEKLVRIGWVIAELPEKLREVIIREAQNRAVIGWASGIKPTEFGQ